MVSARSENDRLLLQTLGGTALLSRDADGSVQPLQLRRKDLALLILLCVEDKPSYARSWLATMLWGEWSDRTRRSLVQALTRLRAILPPDTLVPTVERIEWRGGLCCDTAVLEAAAGSDGPVPAGVFLADFIVGKGCAAFEAWADGKRSRYRELVLSALEQRGREAEECGAWSDALRHGQASVEADPIDEAGHRRIMRAWAAMGERGLALQHYREFREWAESELGSEPESETAALARELAEATSHCPDASRTEAERWAVSAHFAVTPQPTPSPVRAPRKPAFALRRISTAGAWILVVLLAAAGLPRLPVAAPAGSGGSALLSADVMMLDEADGVWRDMGELEGFLACVGWVPSVTASPRGSAADAASTVAGAPDDEDGLRAAECGM